MITFSFDNNQVFCFGIEERNIEKMAAGDPIYVCAETINLPMDFQLTVGKKSTSLIEGRRCFVTDLSDISLSRLRSGSVLHIQQNGFWPVRDTFIFYGEDMPKLKTMAETLIEELTGRTFKDITGKNIDECYPPASIMMMDWKKGLF